MAFSTFNSFSSIIKNNLSVRIEVGDYSFKIKGMTSTVPNSDVTGIPLTNIGGVTMYNDPIRGYVFNFSGSNSLGIPVKTSTNSTKSFWLSTTTPVGNVFSSVDYPIYFNNSILTAYLSYTNTNYPSSSVSQTSAWVHYAVTTSSTELKIYVNGILKSSTALSNFPGDTTDNYFGSFSSSNRDNYKGYIDDMRLYPRALSIDEVKYIYNGM